MSPALGLIRDWGGVEEGDGGVVMGYSRWTASVSLTLRSPADRPYGRAFPLSSALRRVLAQSYSTSGCCTSRQRLHTQSPLQGERGGGHTSAVSLSAPSNNRGGSEADELKSGCCLQLINY